MHSPLRVALAHAMEHLEPRVLLSGMTAFPSEYSVNSVTNQTLPSGSGPASYSVGPTAFMDVTFAEDPGNFNPQSPPTPVTGTISFAWSTTALNLNTPATLIPGPTVATGAFVWNATQEIAYCETVIPINQTDATAAGPGFTAYLGGVRYVDYELLATFSSNYDVSQSTGNGTSTLEVASFNFGTTVSNKLAFIQQPGNTAAGDVIKPPVTVAVEDSAGNTQTSASDTVSLKLNTSVGSPVTTYTAAAVDGIASFDKIAVSDPGKYTLTASDSTATGVGTAVSSQFTVTGGKLVFVKPPTSGTVNEKLSPFTVKLVDGKGKLVANDSSSVVDLSLAGLNSETSLQGTTVMTLSGGMATFSDIAISDAGFFQIQASDGGDTNATTRKFPVTGDKLDFIVQPRNVSTGELFGVKVQALDAKGKPDAELTDQVVLTLNVISGGIGVTSLSTPAEALLAGVADFGSTLSIDRTGVYTLTATADTGADNLSVFTTDSAVTPAVSNKFSVSGLRLKMVRQPGNTDIGKYVAYSVALVDERGRPVTTGTSAGDDLVETLSRPAAFGSASVSPVLTQGTYATAPGGLSILTPGTYQITLTATQADNTGAEVPDPQVQAVTTAQFKILGYHLAFTKQPQNTNIDTEISFTVVLLDSKNKRISDPLIAQANETISIGYTGPESGSIDAPLDGGAFGSGGAVAGEGLTISEAGSYSLTVTAQTIEQGFAVSDPAVLPVTSKKFKVK